MNYPLKRVVITGLGALTPIGNNVTDYWNALLAGVSGADFIKQFDADKFKTKFACELKNFNVDDHIDRVDAIQLQVFVQPRFRFDVFRIDLEQLNQQCRDVGINIM